MRASGGLAAACWSVALIAAVAPHVARAARPMPPMPPNPTACLGEFAPCPPSADGAHPGGDCVLVDDYCYTCKPGQYLCPDMHTCVADAAAYVTGCPGLKGTHLDWQLDLDARVAYLVKAANLSSQIAQLTDSAPAMPWLGIPEYNWLNDDEHGVRLNHATVFPSGNALGASWDKELVWEVGLGIGTEARGGHNGYIHEDYRGFAGNGANGVGITAYAPNLNLVRSPLWGRSQEVASEDPQLTSALTVAYVTGMQGVYPNGTSMDAGTGGAGGGHVLTGACCKHWGAYDIENIPAQRASFNAVIDARSFWEHYVPAFDACITEAHATSVMCSYNSINGVPTCGDPNLLNGMLRKRWGWDGFVVSDYDAWANIYRTHHYTSNMTGAAAVGINAGMDREGGGTSAIEQLPAAIAAGAVQPAAVNAAFGRLMRTRIKLGMFDPPTLNAWNAVPFGAVESAAHTALSRRGASEAVCLYQNRGSVLPLNASLLQRAGYGAVTVIGPFADDGYNLQGNYAIVPTDVGAVSVFDGVQSAMSTPWGDPPGVTFAKGCVNASCADQALFPQAIEAARAAKAVVLVLGTRHDCSFDSVACEGEGHDRTSGVLPGNQTALAQALSGVTKASGAALVCVLVHGGSFTNTGGLFAACDAVVDAWFPGAQGGHGVADVLFGKAVPAGRTPQTWYKQDSDITTPGTMDMYAQGGVTYRYVGVSGAPASQRVAMRFGFGLSYTTFAYSALATNATGGSIAGCDVLGVSVTVTNTGSRWTADEVVQLYVRQPGASVPVPLVRLADFERVRGIAPGESRTVQLRLTPSYHAIVPADNTTRRSSSGRSSSGSSRSNRGGGGDDRSDGGDAGFWDPAIAIEAGEFEVYVGGVSPDTSAWRSPSAMAAQAAADGLLSTKVTVAGAPGSRTLLSSCPQR